MNENLKAAIRLATSASVAAGALAAMIAGWSEGRIADVVLLGMTAGLVVGAATFVVATFVISARQSGLAPLGRALVAGAVFGAVVGLASWCAGWRPVEGFSAHLAVGAAICAVTHAYLAAAKAVGA